MAQIFYEASSWVSSVLQDKMEKSSCRWGCCGQVQICRGRSPECSPDRASIQECVQLLECLADGGRVSCRCQKWLSDPFSLAVVLSRRHEEERRLRGALKSPLQLFRSLFLRVDTMRLWHQMLTADPWLHELLEMCSAVPVPRPRGMCVSCRDRRALGSEVSAGRRHKSSSGQVAGRRRAADPCDYHLSGPDYGDKDFSGTDNRPESGVLASIQRLKNSLKKDLETHQLYLGAIETRLSGLERRAQDVTQHLQRANLELAAIKHGSAALRTLVGETSEEGRPDPGCASKNPAGGSAAPHRTDLLGGLSTCQRQVDFLIQQITQRINRMESDMEITAKQRQSAG